MTTDEKTRLSDIEERLKKVVYLIPTDCSERINPLLKDAHWLAQQLRAHCDREEFVAVK